MSSQQEKETYLRMAVDVARAGVASGGGPFGAVVVKQGKVIATANNEADVGGLWLLIPDHTVPSMIRDKPIPDHRGYCMIRDKKPQPAHVCSQVTLTCDTTAHAEVQAIRRACAALGAFHLTGCELYTSCWCCPMCAAACMWAHVDAVYAASLPEHAAAAGFDDRRFWTRVAQSDVSGQVQAEKAHLDKVETDPVPMKPCFQYVPIDNATAAFDDWINKTDKQPY